jgi:hypothetical protein
MKINKSQKMMLQYLSDIKETGPSLFQMYKLCWNCNLALIIIVILIMISDLIYGVSYSSLVFYGYILGMIMRDFGIKRKQKQNWSVQKVIIDWKKIDHLLNQE